MPCSLAVQLGLRYAFSRGSQLASIGGIAVLGLALSIAVLVAVLSIVNGFERELQQRLFGVLPHVSVMGRGPLRATEDNLSLLQDLDAVNGVAPVVQGTALVAVPDVVRGVWLTGVDGPTYSDVSAIADYTMAGTFAQLDATPFGIALGSKLAAELGVTVGDKVTLVLPQANVTLVGVLPRQKRMTVVALVRTESELDSRAAYIRLVDAQRLFRLGQRIHGYQLRTDDLFLAQDVASQARLALGQQAVYARTWMRSHGNLHHAILVQKQTMFLLLAFLVGVAAFNLVSSLLMVVHQRSPDVAILRTMGASTMTFVVAFTLLALLLGGLGLGLGLGAGVGLAYGLVALFRWSTTTFDLELMNEYFVNYLPVQVQAGDLLAIAAVALLLILASALYPAWRVAQTRPSEVLAHE